jgi:cobalt/nickel transport system permease protein
VHIPDGLIGPEINLATAVVSAGVCGIAVTRANKTLSERQVPLLGVTAAFVFAAQMLNFPVGAGASGHFLGAVLGAILLGPLNACLVMTLVLVVQCLLFADGGLTALGTNVFNMAVVGTLGGYGLFQAARLFLPNTRGAFLTAAAFAAWSSIVLSAGLCAVELAFSGIGPLRLLVAALSGVHAVIGIGEAMITCATVSIVLAARPDLVGTWRTPQPRPAGQET